MNVIRKRKSFTQPAGDPLDGKDSAALRHAALVQRIFSTPFVSDALCIEKLGYAKHTIDAAAKYLELQVWERPALSEFFDREFYGSEYPDVSSDGLDPFLQFMSYGCSQRRSPHPLVDPAYIISNDPHALPDGYSPSVLYETIHNSLVDTSPYFSVEYYSAQVGNVTEGALAHFLSYGMRAGLRPVPLLDPLWYCEQLGGDYDVSAALRHFVLIGDREGRAPCLEFSGRRYLSYNRDVAEAGRPALLHYLTNGKAEGRPYYPHPIAFKPPNATDKPTADPAEDKLDEITLLASYNQAKERIAEIWQRRKNDLSPQPADILRFSNPVHQIGRLVLPRVRHPKVSVLIPVYNALRYTVECISAIVRSCPKTSYEVVLADDASTDDAVQLLRKIKNIKFVSQPSNVGFLANCNASFGACGGTYVLLLNNDVQLMPGSIDALVQVLDANPDVAAVGPKLIYPDGRLQEAGCMLDRDGKATMVGLFADLNSPEYNRERDVHYCSGAALLVRRSQIGPVLFDERFAPAYCEDADLCLRLLSNKHRVVYCPRAVAVHHLSVSSSENSSCQRLQLIVRNQQKLACKWSVLLEKLNEARVIAFYLPQYHPTPENDLHWGAGFTEWTNVAKATPAFAGHYQPHLPADLGYYDLRVQQTLERQVSLARRYGIDGFCVYYYNFGSRRTLDQAFEAIVANQTIDFPFCVCWANENWTRRWDGGDQQIIFEQEYDRAALRGVVQDAVRYAADSRYLRVNGKPLFLVYRPLLIPDPQGFSTFCRQSFQSAGFSDVHLVYVESMETAERASEPSVLGFDASVEFPPHGRGVAVADPQLLVQSDFVGIQYDYEAAISADLHRPPAGHTRYPTVFPSWDNTPRHTLRGDSFVGATPEVFQAYIEEKLDHMRSLFVGDERLLFINAWNEWAEGAHLEPDRKFGHRWLEAVHNALITRSLA